METAISILNFLREGGPLAGLVLALIVVWKMWAENQRITQQVLAEKDAHRATSEKVAVIAARFLELIAQRERRSRNALATVAPREKAPDP